MKRLASATLATLILFCLVVAAEKPAFGYVDPGSGFVALQSLASVAAACGYFLRRRIKTAWTRLDAKEATSAATKQSNFIKAA